MAVLFHLLNYDLKKRIIKFYLLEVISFPQGKKPTVKKTLYILIRILLHLLPLHLYTPLLYLSKLTPSAKGKKLYYLKVKSSILLILSKASLNLSLFTVHAILK